jgi:KDO2-lipid IV(A) lauroyltransferase
MQVTRGQCLAFVLNITGQLPLFACRLLGRLAGLMLWIVPNKSRRITQVNIALCFPELSTAQQRKLVFNSLQHTGMLALETALIWRKPYRLLKQYMSTIVNLDLLEAAKVTDRGIVILLPHLGNWEIFSRYMPVEHDLIMALYEPPSITELESLIKTGREKDGAKLVPTNARGVSALLKHLRKGGITLILPDQVPDLNTNSGVFAPFFKQATYTMTLATQLAQKTNSHILAATAKRIGSGFEIKFSKPEASIYAGDALVAIAAMNRLVEQCVREMPEQYQWEYKRFKRRPDGAQSPYK